MTIQVEGREHNYKHIFFIQTHAHIQTQTHTLEHTLDKANTMGHQDID